MRPGGDCGARHSALAPLAPAQAKGHMEASSVVDSSTGKSIPSQVRTSTGTFFAKGADSVISRIENRVAQVTMIPVGEVLRQVLGWMRGLGKGGGRRHVCGCVARRSRADNQEGLQILNYHDGQKYEPHYGEEARKQRSLGRGGSKRAATTRVGIPQAFA